MKPTNGAAVAVLREAAAVGVYAALMTPTLFWTFALLDLLLLRGWTRESFTLESVWWYMKHSYAVIGIYFHPPPSWVLNLTIGAICALVWCSGQFWCRLFGRQRRRDAFYYDRAENVVRRCRLLGGVAGVPAVVAVATYYTFTAPPIFAVYYYAGFAYGVGRIGPALDRIARDPGAVLDYTVKGIAFLAFLAAPFAVSAAIGAMCGWLYGRWVRPLVQRLWPAFPGAA